MVEGIHSQFYPPSPGKCVNSLPIEYNKFTCRDTSLRLWVQSHILGDIPFGFIFRLGLGFGIIAAFVQFTNLSTNRVSDKTYDFNRRLTLEGGCTVHVALTSLIWGTIGTDNVGNDTVADEDGTGN